MKKYFLLLLALCLLQTATAQELVRVPANCIEGNAFTIKIPVKFPEDMRVDYRWYRNDTLIEDSHALLMESESKISYTIPAGKAYGAATFHFEYRCDDGCTEWTSSPKYAVSFLPSQTSEIAGDTAPCAGARGLIYSVTNVQGVAYSWTVPDGWFITAGQGTNSITVGLDVNDVGNGNISVTPSSGGNSGIARTLAVKAMRLPAKPVITGDTVACAGAADRRYFVQDAGKNTTYRWKASGAGWGITEIVSPDHIKATAGTANGVITVTPSNACGDGLAGERNVQVTASCGTANFCISYSGVVAVTSGTCSGISYAGAISVKN